MKKFFEKTNMTPNQEIDILLLALLIVFVAQNVESAEILFLSFRLTRCVFLVFFVSLIFADYGMRFLKEVYPYG